MCHVFYLDDNGCFPNFILCHHIRYELFLIVIGFAHAIDIDKPMGDTVQFLTLLEADINTFKGKNRENK